MQCLQTAPFLGFLFCFWTLIFCIYVRLHNSDYLMSMKAERLKIQASRTGGSVEGANPDMSERNVSDVEHASFHRLQLAIVVLYRRTLVQGKLSACQSGELKQPQMVKLFWSVCSHTATSAGVNYMASYHHWEGGKLFKWELLQWNSAVWH